MHRKEVLSEIKNIYKENEEYKNTILELQNELLQVNEDKKQVQNGLKMMVHDIIVHGNISKEQRQELGSMLSENEKWEHKDVMVTIGWFIHNLYQSFTK